MKRKPFLVRAATRIVCDARDVLRNIYRTASYLVNSSSVPEYLYLESTNICNASCVFCAYQHDKRPKKVLTEELLQKATGEYSARGGRKIGLTPLLGEIFSDSTILKKLSLLKDSRRFDQIHTYTNATLMHKFGVGEVLRSGITELRISVPPLEAELYKSIYRNSNYQNVLKNIRDLLIAFGELKDKTVQSIHIEFRADRSLEECKALPDFVTYVQPYLRENVHIIALRDFDSWNGAIAQSDLPDGMRLIETPNRRRPSLPCSRLFNVQVLSDGRLRQCGCRVDTKASTDDLALGHLDSSSIMSAYNSADAKKNVVSFLTGNLPPLCQKCSWYGWR